MLRSARSRNRTGKSRKMQQSSHSLSLVRPAPPDRSSGQARISESFEGESKQDAVFLDAAIIANNRAERRDPARQVAID